MMTKMTFKSSMRCLVLCIVIPSNYRNEIFRYNKYFGIGSKCVLVCAYVCKIVNVI